MKGFADCHIHIRGGNFEVIEKMCVGQNKIYITKYSNKLHIKFTIKSILSFLIIISLKSK